MTFVPGRGNIATNKDVKDFVTYLRTSRPSSNMSVSAASPENLIRAALPELARKQGDWTAFSYFARLELGYMEQELAGVQRAPKPVDD